MKPMYVLFMPFMFSFLCLQSVEPVDYQGISSLMGIHTPVQFPSNISINEYKHQIEKDLYRNNVIRGAIKGGVSIGVAAGILAICYSIYNNYKFVNVTQLHGQMTQYLAVVGAVVDDLKKKFPQVSIDAPEMQEQVKKIKDMLEAQAKQGWGEWAWSFGVFIGQSLALSHVHNIMANEVFHDVTVEWFSIHRTALESIYKELSALDLDIAALKSRSMYITQYQADRYANSLIRLSNALITDLESVIGYINMRVEHLNLMASDVHGDHFLGNYLEQRAAALATKMQELSASYQKQTQDDERIATIVSMFGHIKQLSLEINSSLSGFKRFELQKQAA